jgi:dephospho-CoA kinase
MIAGLTGGIGSGKSLVAKLFELLGCVVFNSDETAKELYFDSALQPEITSLLGKEAYLTATQINKTHISTKIFNDPAMLLKLNAIIHPAVIHCFKLFADANRGKIIIKETALLFETKQQAQMDKVIMVASDDALRMQRVMQRDQLTQGDVLRKMNSQLPQEEKIKGADFVIYNNEAQFLITQVLTIYNQLKDA